MHEDDKDAPMSYCIVTVPPGRGYRPVAEALRQGVTEAGYRLLSPEVGSLGVSAIYDDLVRADCVIADLTNADPGVLYQIGMARAMGKIVFPVMQNGPEVRLPFDLANYRHVAYDATPNGFKELAILIENALLDFRRSPPRLGTNGGVRFVPPFFVDWNRLSRSDSENLCHELLTQMGYRRVEWVNIAPEFDLVAELPKKDPDGFEYRELWLVSMGRFPVSSATMEMLIYKPEYFLHRLFRDGQERLSNERDFENVTVLFVALDDDYSEQTDRLLRLRHGVKRSPGGLGVRIRVWTKDFLTQLVHQFPQIGYKYFSEHARSTTKYRKSLDELYQENVALSEKQTYLISALEEEKNKRVRAERDSAWKDISFAAAHKIGNPIFAIETNLDPLRRRIREGRAEEAILVTDEISVSVEKAKDIVDQFKSLTRIQEMQPCPTLLRPIIEHSCDRARNMGVNCSIECPDDLLVMVDPYRIAECFDELVANAENWLRGQENRIEVKVTVPNIKSLPQTVESGRPYARVLFADNGLGVSIANKSRIFDAFFTTRDQGTGLGLALIRRIVEGHGGTISEIGSPTEGAIFEIYLPLPGGISEKPTAKPVAKLSLKGKAKK